MSRNTKINLLLLLVVAALAVLPLALGLGDHKEEPFTGADGEAETAITEIEPDYEPWFSPLYEPPSGAPSVPRCPGTTTWLSSMACPPPT